MHDVHAIIGHRSPHICSTYVVGGDSSASRAKAMLGTLAATRAVGHCRGFLRPDSRHLIGPSLPGPVCCRILRAAVMRPASNSRRLDGQLQIRLTATLTPAHKVLRGPGAIAGSLPGSWGVQGSFASLQWLSLSDLPLTGTLPISWGSNGGFAQLTLLQIGPDPLFEQSYRSMLGGTLPSQWATPGTFPQLSVLTISNHTISGAGHAPMLAMFVPLHRNSCGCCTCNCCR